MCDTICHCYLAQSDNNNNLCYILFYELFLSLLLSLYFSYWLLLVCCYFNCCNKIICWKTNKLLCQEDDVFSFSPQITSLYPTTLKAIHSVFTMFSFASLCPVDTIWKQGISSKAHVIHFLLQAKDCWVDWIKISVHTGSLRCLLSGIDSAY